ncbi:uncharacterized protein TrAtP1_000290 [Trichoderma atroviride]|uniref:Uncharacterized protein n=1 Tax=Hypocrea atroviridis (strain ATCC 20476 / IMI 206040) TaxID=452589 RepID=G9NJP0_HYPAI|nr:uncharacterized protein TRIATDRAFT_160355 [Trichoderma atroviride IMI 206040]EHK49113.1 hypothetical protein TRIATDRAFT_160355 [Trichoderma atroviride IMI 206040]UKZ58970.1 hypothetical protein TrAtP1_000290 [Trichoderma atroviride]
MNILNPSPWKLPSPFVGITFRAFCGLIMLANASAVYGRLEILSISANFVLTTNISFTCLILVMIAMFCEQRWRNNYFSRDVKIFCLSFASLWAMVFTSNFGFIVSGFVVCHVPSYQHEAEAKYCHFFGNHKIAEIPDRAGWLIYFWIVMAVTLSIACWQTISWLHWYFRISDLLRRRATTATAA